MLPELCWRPLTRAIGQIETGLQAGRREAASGPFDEALARSLECSTRSIAIERVASGHAAKIWGLRKYLRSRRDPPIDVVGMEHIEEALAKGRGVILWVGRFTWASIITKVGLWRAGCLVTHLSRPSHGFGTSPFAVRRLNPIWTRIEERFLRERVVIQPGAETAALRAFRRRLEANGVVSVAVGDEGVRTVTVPFLDGQLCLATGPGSLALACGAPLLPVFTVQEPTGRFRIAIEASVVPPPDQAIDPSEERIALKYATRLEPWVLRHPGQWLL